MRKENNGPEPAAENILCIAAILRDEEKFLDEWIIYHRIIGIGHFFLYDDDPSLPLKEFLEPHASYVTVIPWYNMHADFSGRNRQTKAYLHANQNFAAAYSWIAFIDADEFIALRTHAHVKDFLAEFSNMESVSLNWHVFGHNGYYDDPPGLISALLTRRKYSPTVNVKSITRPAAITDITSAHFCRMQDFSKRADANRRVYSDTIYAGKSDRAHINHYQCRSFSRWMKRVSRGDVDLEQTADIAEGQKWRTKEESTLRQFVTTVAKDRNEYTDEFMLRYSNAILHGIQKLGRTNDQQ